MYNYIYINIILQLANKYIKIIKEHIDINCKYKIQITMFYFKYIRLKKQNKYRMYFCFK